MIVSAIDGRMRAVDSGLKNETRAAAVENHLREVDGVRKVEVNRLTGSLLILYDTSLAGTRTVRKAVLSQLRASKSQSATGPLTGKRARRLVKIVMLGSISGSLGILLAGSEKYHYRVGLVFVSCLWLHLYQNRKRLFK